MRSPLPKLKCPSGILAPDTIRRGRIPLNDLCGKVFGKLTAVKLMGTVHRDAYWRCRCSCGRVVYIRRSNLTDKTQPTRTCGRAGCRAYLRGKDHPSWRGHGEMLGSQISRIKYNAKSRGHTFNVTIAFLWDLFCKQEGRCALSGLKLTLRSTPTEKCTASVDRIDATKGYETDNVQWVHMHVNRMKNVFNQDLFVEFCCAVADFQRNRKDRRGKTTGSVRRRHASG